MNDEDRGKQTLRATIHLHTFSIIPCFPFRIPEVVKNRKITDRGWQKKLLLVTD